jgi:hypothetical protein
MQKLKEQCRSANLLLKSVEKLAASLDSEYEPQPSDPSTEYCNAALQVVFFCKCVLNELVELEKYDLRGTGGLRLAIALSDLELAQRLFREEIKDIVREDPVYAAEFTAEIRATVAEMKFGGEWLKLVL